MVSKLSTPASRRSSASSARPRLLELAVIVGVACASLSVFQTMSPVIQATLTGSAKVTISGEDWRDLQNRLDRMQKSLDLTLGNTNTNTNNPQLPTSTISYLPTPPANDIDPLVTLLSNKTEKVLYYNLGKGGAGFGSLINNMVYVASYARISQGRKLVVDESDLELYRKDSTHGMLSGYFDTDFEIVSTKCHTETVRMHTGVDLAKLPPYKTEKEDHDQPIIRVTTHDSNTFNKARKEARSFYSHPTVQRAPGKIHQFYTLTTEYCSRLKVNAATQKAIQEILQTAKMPDFEHSGDSVTVAMHVRRGDKAQEVRHSPVKKYIRELKAALRDTEPQLASLQIFVATDDYAAFLEIQREVAKSPTLANCKLYTLASPAGHNRDGNDFTLLLAEMKMMIDATFFIGTYTSNIHTAVTFLRGCRHPAVKDKGLPPVGQEYKILTPEQVGNRLDHYYKSYGIESDEWFMFTE